MAFQTPNGSRQKIAVPAVHCRRQKATSGLRRVYEFYLLPITIGYNLGKPSRDTMGELKVYRYIIILGFNIY